MLGKVPNVTVLFFILILCVDQVGHVLSSVHQISKLQPNHFEGLSSDQIGTLLRDVLESNLSISTKTQLFYMVMELKPNGSKVSAARAERKDLKTRLFVERGPKKPVPSAAFTFSNHVHSQADFVVEDKNYSARYVCLVSGTCYVCKQNHSHRFEAALNSPQDRITTTVDGISCTSTTFHTFENIYKRVKFSIFGSGTAFTYVGI